MCCPHRTAHCKCGRSANPGWVLIVSHASEIVTHQQLRWQRCILLNLRLFFFLWLNISDKEIVGYLSYEAFWTALVCHARPPSKPPTLPDSRFWGQRKNTSLNINKDTFWSTNKKVAKKLFPEKSPKLTMVLVLTFFCAGAFSLGRVLNTE